MSHCVWPGSLGWQAQCHGGRGRHRLHLVESPLALLDKVTRWTVHSTAPRASPTNSVLCPLLTGPDLSPQLDSLQASPQQPMHRYRHLPVHIPEPLPPQRIKSKLGPLCLKHFTLVPTSQLQSHLKWVLGGPLLCPACTESSPTRGSSQQALLSAPCPTQQGPTNTFNVTDLGSTSCPGETAE